MQNKRPFLFFMPVEFYGIGNVSLFYVYLCKVRNRKEDFFLGLLKKINQ